MRKNCDKVVECRANQATARYTHVLAYLIQSNYGVRRNVLSYLFHIIFWDSCRTATLDIFFDLAESKVAVFLCSILTSDGIPFCFGKNSFL